MSAVATWSRGEAPAPDYSRDVQPLLAEHCFACHGADAESREADLRLDNAASAHEWAIVPGDPDESEVLARVFSDDPDVVMPLRQRRSDCRTTNGRS